MAETRSETERMPEEAAECPIAVVEVVEMEFLQNRMMSSVVEIEVAFVTGLMMHRDRLVRLEYQSLTAVWAWALVVQVAQLTSLQMKTDQQKKVL